MSKVTNTKNNPRPDWLFGGNPGAIEQQEATGQQELVDSSQLPINDMRDEDVKETYEKMGIIVLSQTEGDDLFYDVTLPEGWAIKATDHSMWSDLVDNKGNVRARIFYKAAFYDRRADVRFCTRYRVVCHYSDDPGPNGRYLEKYSVEDRGLTIFDTKFEEPDKNGEVPGRKQCETYLKKHFPKHEDILAYWKG